MPASPDTQRIATFLAFAWAAAFHGETRPPVGWIPPCVSYFRD
jgi:hypothetical protein